MRIETCWVSELGGGLRSSGFTTRDQDGLAPVEGLGVEEALGVVTWEAPASALSHAPNHDPVRVVKTWAEEYAHHLCAGNGAMSAEHLAIGAVRSLPGAREARIAAGCNSDHS